MEINPNNRNIPASDEGRTPPPVRRAVPPASSAGDRSASEGIVRNAASHEPGASEGRRIPGTAPRAEPEPKPHLAAQGRFPRKAPNADSRCPTRRARAARYRGRTPHARSRSRAPFRGSSPRRPDHGRKCKNEPCRAARLRVRRSARETKIPLPRRVPHLRQDPRRERT